MGGKFKDGFMSAAVAKLAGQIGLIDYLGGGKSGDGDTIGRIKRTIVAGAIGGIVSEVGGGKFANGAYTAAFQHLFNSEGFNPKDIIRVEEGLSEVLNQCQKK